MARKLTASQLKVLQDFTDETCDIKKTSDFSPTNGGYIKVHRQGFTFNLKRSTVEALLARGLVEERNNMFVLTPEGRAELAE
ncbi:MAG: hypothetical protein JSS66_07410 [Armatimonadetes bacterium]|nr:hypothetical protein [Armatimonadota bacterium]